MAGQHPASHADGARRHASGFDRRRPRPDALLRQERQYLPLHRHRIYRDRLSRRLPHPRDLVRVHAVFSLAASIPNPLELAGLTPFLIRAPLVELGLLAQGSAPGGGRQRTGIARLLDREHLDAGLLFLLRLCASSPCIRSDSPLPPAAGVHPRNFLPARAGWVSAQGR